MPELPEVETIRRGLEKYIIGYTVNDIEIRLAKQFHGDTKNVIGGKIITVRRYGKGLLIDLDNGYSLAIHVKMTGQLLFIVGQGAGNNVTHTIDLPNKHTHVIFTLKNKNGKSETKNAYLYYNDQRQFGWIKVVRTSESLDMPFFKSLGKEPLKDLTEDDFIQLLTRANTSIKLLIMDQSKIAGIGNIYANDALFRAKVHPVRPAKSLTPDEMHRLFKAIEEVLTKGILVGGASEWHYMDVLGEKGQYQNFFLVYGKDGDTCTQCGSSIERIVLGGRGTFFCPICQRL
jgi:formamidopyrimidine-DNA glycosylase